MIDTDGVNFNFITDLINATKNIQWTKLVDDIQIMLNENLKLNQTWDLVINKLWKNDFVTATIFSLLFVIFYWCFIFIDSKTPGVNPPTPFTSMQKRR